MWRMHKYLCQEVNCIHDVQFECAFTHVIVIFHSIKYLNTWYDIDKLQQFFSSIPKLELAHSVERINYATKYSNKRQFLQVFDDSILSVVLRVHNCCGFRHSNLQMVRDTYQLYEFQNARNCWKISQVELYPTESVLGGCRCLGAAYSIGWRMLDRYHSLGHHLLLSKKIFQIMRRRVPLLFLSRKIFFLLFL